jgi:Xaa-Pro dipeptidase
MTRRERALEVLGAARAGALVAADPGTVAWLTGVEADIESGPSPFALPPLAVLEADGTLHLVASEDDAAGAECAVVTYPGFTLEPLDPLGHARRALGTLVEGRRLALEAGTLPAGLVDGADWVDVTAALLRARAVKDADEVERLRAAIALCDTGQAALRAALAPGRSELELWTDVRGAIEAQAAGRVPLLADLASGPRTAEVGGPPGARTLVDGDLVLCDLVPRLGGVWGDSCATVAVGEPSAWAVAAHRRCVDALGAALEAVRPGMQSGDLDALVRRRLDFPHHTGHGIGGAAHEEPRIVPGGTMRLEAGMVVALEPGLYGEHEGVRVEHVALVTADGCEVLSGHDLAL